MGNGRMLFCDKGGNPVTTKKGSGFRHEPGMFHFTTSTRKIGSVVAHTQLCVKCGNVIKVE